MKKDVCPDCQGTGHILIDGAVHECQHILREKAIAYLTPYYADSSYMNSLDVEQLRDKNLTFINNAQFKTVVKSFLLGTGMVYSHRSATAYEILQAYLTNSDDREFTKMGDVDLLFIYLSQDPKNGHYGQIISSLIINRNMKGKKTWINSRNPLNSPDFVRMYGGELETTLNELKFNKVN